MSRAGCCSRGRRPRPSSVWQKDNLAEVGALGYRLAVNDQMNRIRQLLGNISGYAAAK